MARGSELAAPALRLSSREQDKEPPCRAVAGICFEAVKEQAGRRRALVIMYLLY